MTKRIRFGLIFVGPRPAADGSFLGDLGIKFIEGCSVGERHYVLFALERPRRPVDVLNAVYEYNRRCPTAELDEELLMASDGVLTSGGSAIMLLTPSCEESASQPSSSKHGPPLQVSSSASSGSRTKKHHSSSAAAALAKVAVFEKGHSFQSHEISRAIRTAKLAHLRVEAPPIPGELLLSAAASPGGGAPRQPMSCSPSGAVAIPTGYWSWGTSSPSSAQSLSGDEEGQRTPSVTVPSSPLPCDGRPRDGAPSSSSSSGIDSVAAPRRPASPLPGVAPSSAAPPSQGRAANKNKKKSGAGSRKRSGVDALESDLVQDSIRPSAPKRARGACCAPADVVGAAVNDRQEAGKEEEEGVPAPPPLPFSPLSGIMDGLTTGGGRSGEGGDGVPVAAAASAPSPLEAVDDPLASMELPDVRAMLEAAAAGEDEDEDAERPRRCGRQEGGEAEGGVETPSRAAVPMAAGGGARKEEEPFEEEQVGKNASQKKQRTAPPGKSQARSGAASSSPMTPSPTALSSKKRRPQQPNHPSPRSHRSHRGAGITHSSAPPPSGGDASGGGGKRREGGKAGAAASRAGARGSAAADGLGISAGDVMALVRELIQAKDQTIRLLMASRRTEAGN